MAQASNWQWLRNSGLDSLSEQDWQHLSATLNKTLDTALPGETLNWNNPESGHGGFIKVLKNLDSGDRHCREVRIVTESSRKREGEPLTFCKEDNGEWLIDTSPAGKKDGSGR